MIGNVVIVSRTKMNNGVCCGGVNMITGEYIRLHNERGGHLSFDAPYQIGEVYHLCYETAWNVRPKPHIEDKQVLSYAYRRKMTNRELVQFIENNCTIYYGDLNSIFEGLLHQSAYASYINHNGVPNHSVCFWKPNAPLRRTSFLGKIKYCFGNNNIPYVGYQTPIDTIPAGTLLRMSLANWWSRDCDTEERCYLQLSGWYEY